MTHPTPELIALTEPSVATPPVVASKRAVLYLRVSTADQAHGDGASEGYSIPAQRDACTRRAQELGATVVAEFVDRGESARSAARPQLQMMLARLAEHQDIDYVIVHKVDRLARNRADDVQIQVGIKKGGARLVSVTESVDDTPSGKLVHNIMADLAEFYSANLASEILKGSTQKASMGGTPYLAPVGYVNTRYFIEGREVRTIEVDPERAPFIRRAFELFATGEYSVKSLHSQLTAEGLRTRPTPKRPSRPLTLSKFHCVLRNRYYVGVVSYRGVEHPGKHPAIVGQGLFDQVQAILEDRERYVVKPYRNNHYLRGLLTCARCRARMLYTTGRGKSRETFDYYICGRRHRGGDCDLPYLGAAEIETRVAHAWPVWVRLDQVKAEAVAKHLQALIANEKDHPERIARAQKKIAKLEAERLKLVKMAYADAIPLDLLKREQDRIRVELERAERALKTATGHSEDVLRTYNQARAVMIRGAKAYELGGPDVRRLLIRAFLASIAVDQDVANATLASPWTEIQKAAGEAPEHRPTTRAAKSRAARPHRSDTTKNTGPQFEDRCSTLFPLVEVLAAYSNSGHLADLQRYLTARPVAVAPAAAPTPRRPWALADRLDEHTRADLIHAYRGGTTAMSLADVHGLSLRSVKRLLASAEVRRQQMPA